MKTYRGLYHPFVQYNFMSAGMLCGERAELSLQAQNKHNMKTSKTVCKFITSVIGTAWKRRKKTTSPLLRRTRSNDDVLAILEQILNPVVDCGLLLLLIMMVLLLGGGGESMKN